MKKQKSTKTLRIGEAAKLLGVSTMTLRRWDKKGVLKPLKFGKRPDRRYLKDELLKLLRKK